MNTRTASAFINSSRKLQQTDGPGQMGCVRRDAGKGEEAGGKVAERELSGHAAERNCGTGEEGGEGNANNLKE